MRFSKYIPLLVLLFSFTAGFSQNIIRVTSKEDSGPGTLRAALTATANNGTTVKDEIHFFLPTGGLNDNIIRLRSQLPIVTSNVTIDGTTQSGQSLGVSGAKIIIEPELPLYSGFSCLTIGANPYSQTNNINYQTTDVAIYGLYIRKFDILENLNISSQISGIIIDYRVDRIKIGAAGKGNVIGGNSYGILLRNNNNGADLANKFDNISIQGNLIGVTDDGFTDESNFVGINGDISFAALTIGGDAAADGNVISANATDISITRNYSTSLPMLLNIFSNKVGTDFSGKKHYKNISLFSGSSTVVMNGIKINAGNTTANISKNIISGHLTTGLSITNSEFLITGNLIGTGVAGTEDLGNVAGIKIEGTATGKIGGSAVPDPNLIGFNRFGIESSSSRAVTITRNSIFCNSQLGIGKVSAPATQAFIQVLKINSGYITGKASPGSEVELFYTDDCPNSCQGKTYITTVRAGVDGKWKYEGPVSGKVVGTASITNGVTSQFSTAGLLEGEAIIKQITCKGLGSVTVTEEREGISFNLYKLEANGSEGLISQTQSTPNLQVGNYELRVYDGCSMVPTRFSITDQMMSEITVTTPQPRCGQTSFNFTASVFRFDRNVNFVWTNAAGSVVANGTSVNLPEGTYKVTATDASDCVKSYNFPEIKRKPQLYIKSTAVTAGPARCGKTDGYIHGVTVGDDEGLVVTYTWYFYSVVNGSPVIGAQIKTGTDPDIDGLASGTYYLIATSAGGCSPATPYIQFVGETKSVKITGGIPSNTTCSSNNGAINSIVITEGNTYKLTTSTGTLVTEGTCNPGVPFYIPNLFSGNYVLYASHSVTHCEADPFPVTITATPIFQYFAQVTSNSEASCGLDNGSITLNYPNNIKPLEGKYHWENAAGERVEGTAEKLENLTNGFYTLRITDPNGCTSNPLGPYEVTRIEKLYVDLASGIAHDDECGLLRGTITGVKITGGKPLSGTGETAVYRYEWLKNGTNEVVGRERDLTRAGAGTYILKVEDQTTCGQEFSQPITINAPTVQLVTPTVTNVNICYSTEIRIPILAPEEGNYELYADKEDARPIVESGKDKGFIILKVGKTADYFIKRRLGTCESDFTTFHVEVTIDNLEITNTLTPNGDGMNDYWVINGLPENTTTNIKLYTRNGQLVYESSGHYEKPFDGRFRGKDLPAGVYYYKIDLNTDCAPLGGSLTLLR